MSQSLLHAREYLEWMCRSAWNIEVSSLLARSVARPALAGPILPRAMRVNGRNGGRVTAPALPDGRGRPGQAGAVRSGTAARPRDLGRRAGGLGGGRRRAGLPRLDGWGALGALGWVWLAGPSGRHAGGCCARRAGVRCGRKMAVRHNGGRGGSHRLTARSSQPAR
jgi:hypothetical protein